MLSEVMSVHGWSCFRIERKWDYASYPVRSISPPSLPSPPSLFLLVEGQVKEVIPIPLCLRSLFYLKAFVASNGANDPLISRGTISRHGKAEEETCELDARDWLLLSPLHE